MSVVNKIVERFPRLSSLTNAVFTTTFSMYATTPQFYLQSWDIIQKNSHASLTVNIAILTNAVLNYFHVYVPMMFSVTVLCLQYEEVV